MKKKNILVFIVLAGLLVGIGYFVNARYHIFKGHSSAGKADVAKDSYYCPMHPNFTSDKPGDCAICGMKLVKKAALPAGKEINHEGHNSAVKQGSAEGGVQISSERQQFIGVKSEAVSKRQLTRQINTVGKVAYDPELYVAQEEYLQALKTANTVKQSVLASVSQQSDSLLQSAQKKLLLLGMSQEEISQLAKKGQAQENLYFPQAGGVAWVYITIYEYELDMVKQGLPVEIEAVAFPGTVFLGKITAITPVLDPMTRSAQARAEVNDPQHKLKPEMFVDVKINVDLGVQLALPKEAVMDSGLRKIVFVVLPDGYFQAREVKTGVSTDEYVQVMEGLSEGEKVVVSGNFLIDSESKLKAALEVTGQGHQQHGQ